jgi:hypothetical protein
MTSKQPLRIYVKRGALRRWDRLTKAVSLPVRLEWDRRTTERPAPSGTETNDGQTKDRRKPPPFTWEVAQFVVVEEGKE